MIINKHEKMLWTFGRLPKEYQEVEWIGKGAVNTCWLSIPITELPYGKISIKWSGSGSSRQYIFGTYNTSAQRFILTSENSTDVNFFYYYGNSYAEPYITLSDNRSNVHEYEFKFYQNEYPTLYLDGTLTTTGSRYYVEFATNNPLCIFARYYSGSVQRDTSASTLYYFKYEKEDGTMLFDLVPCYRKSDNVIGMYDLVSNTFFTNSGTGTFTKGNNI